MRYILPLFFIISMLLSSVNAQENASDILKKMDNSIFSIGDKSSDVEMKMINLKNNSIKIKKATLLQKGLDKKLFRYTYPKSDSGIASLTIPEGVYLYLPMFKKPKKITNLAESNAFNKSDFSLQDANTKPFSEVYTPKLLESNQDNYLLDLIPKDRNSFYSHLIITINKQYLYPEKIKYYDSKNQEIKEANYEYIKVGKLWVVSSVSMRNTKKKHETKFIMTNIKINTGLSDDLFKVENMVKK